MNYQWVDFNSSEQHHSTCRNTSLMGQRVKREALRVRTSIKPDSSFLNYSIPGDKRILGGPSPEMRAVFEKVGDLGLVGGEKRVLGSSCISESSQTHRQKKLQLSVIFSSRFKHMNCTLSRVNNFTFFSPFLITCFI